MFAFIFAVLIILATVLWCVVMTFAQYMSTNPSANPMPVKGHFITGAVIAAVVAASHWLPNLGW